MFAKLVSVLITAFIVISNSRTSSRNGLAIPCNSVGEPRGICSNRIKPWSEIRSNSLCSGMTYLHKGSQECENKDNKDRIRSHLKTSQRFCVKFDGRDGREYGIIMYSGEYWQYNPTNRNNYNCQGRCGPDCGGIICSNWSGLCLVHDICSWYFSASDGSSDANCGDEFKVAQKDWNNCCNGTLCPARCKGSDDPWMGNYLAPEY